MALTQASSPVPIKSRPIGMRRTGDGFAPEAGLAPRRAKRSPRLMAAMGFAAGMLLVLLLAVLILPIDFNALGGGQLDSADQRAFITMVADKYWHTKDAARLQKNLAGWNRDELNQIIVAMQADSPDAQSRQQLAALAQALHLPGATSSFTGTVFNQPVFWLGVILAIIPLIAASAMVVIPRLRTYSPKDEPEFATTATIQALEGHAAKAGLVEQIDLEQAQQEVANVEKTEGEAEAVEKKEEVEVQAPAEEPEDQNNPLGDLASLFDDSEESSISLLENLCKGLKEIGAEELVEKGKQILSDLRQAIAQRPSLN